MYSLGYYIKHPISFISGCISKIPRLIPAKLYVTIVFKATLDYRPNLRNPKTFNEKIQWLKLYDHNPLYTKLADKYLVKDYIAQTIGKQYVIPLLGVYDKFDDIDFDKLPNQFVLKCNHDGGSVIVVRDKTQFDKKSAKKKLEKALKFNYYNCEKGWAYKNIKPKIIAEKYMEDKEYPSIRDYKFFCFNGEPKIMYLSEGLENHATAGISFFDMDFNLSDCKRSDYRQIRGKVEKPKTFEQMKGLAKILSKDIPHVRVDFYEINGKIYFGEMTFYTCGGYVPFEDKKWDLKFGGRLKL